jgi:sugar phosphate isomerase/epimerase
MKLGCVSSSYRAAMRDGRMDLRGWLRTCAQDLDVDGVEFDRADLPSTDSRTLRELKHQCTNLHLTIAGVSVATDFTRASTRTGEVERVKQWCDVAAYLGAPIVRVTAGSVSPHESRALEQGRIVGLFKRVFGERTPDRRRIWSDVMWALRSCADYAGERGVTVAVQNSADGGALLDHGPAIWQAVRDVGSPWLRGCIDPAALATTTGMDLAIAHTVQVRACVRRVQDDGSDSALYWPETLRALRLGGYRGFVLVDYTGSEDASTALPRAARYMRGLLQILQRQEQLGAELTPGANGASPHDAAQAVREAARTTTSRWR